LRRCRQRGCQTWLSGRPSRRLAWRRGGRFGRSARGRRRRRRLSGSRHRGRDERLRDGVRLHQPVGCVVVGVLHVAAVAAWSALDARASGRRGSCRSLAIGVRGRAPSDGIDHGSVPAPQGERAAVGRKAPGICGIAEWTVDAGRVGHKQMTAWVEQERRCEECLSSRCTSRRRYVEKIAPAKVDRGRTGIRDLDVLVRR